jgi:hypothetical protein
MCRTQVSQNATLYLLQLPGTTGIHRFSQDHWMARGLLLGYRVNRGQRLIARAVATDAPLREA